MLKRLPIVVLLFSLALLTFRWGPHPTEAIEDTNLLSKDVIENGVDDGTDEPLELQRKMGPCFRQATYDGLGTAEAKLSYRRTFAPCPEYSPTPSCFSMDEYWGLSRWADKAAYRKSHTVNC